ncbi:26S protease subunit RPT4 [Thelohanellus kitauei]|uniref:26S protease subunit RPT4 n=1 Tax=Thelohanellus kitauei TaxID=669202 RepID=A0A0C2J680_THEKT|nr:26S protease subunit RPT4 [Thelohanellus kitauei]
MTEVASRNSVEESEALIAHRKAIEYYKQKVIEHRTMLEKFKELNITLKKVNSDFEALENQVNSMQCVGQLIADILRKMSDEKYIVRTSNGPRYVVGVKKDVKSV